MDDFERELKEAFLQEADQLLLDAEQCFLGLESVTNDPSVVEKIFRLAHSLKGSAHAVGFNDIGVLTHELESLLVKIKNGHVKIDSAVVTLLLKCNDHLRQIVNRLKSDLTAPVDIFDLLLELKSFLETHDTGPEAGPKEPLPVIDFTPPASAFDTVPTVTATPAEPVAAPVQAVPVHAPTPTPAPAPADPFASPFAAAPEAAVVRTPAATTISTPATAAAPAVAPAAPLSLAPAPAPAAASNMIGSAPAGAPAAAAAKTTPPSGQAALKTAGATDEGIRVSLRRLEVLMNNIGELVILQTVLSQQKSQIASSLVQKTIGQLGKITKDIQAISMSLRMIPLKQTFQKLQRTVRDTSRTLGKQIVFTTTGDETEMDKTVIDHLGDPLVHLIRNAVDHGVEDPSVRVMAGKPPAGEVTIRAFHEGSRIVVEVQDDGKGLNPDVLRAKAIEKGLIAPGTVLTEKQALDLIFHPGFSTKTEVTEVSGRGVGMDVVKSNIEKLQGEIQIRTQVGQGTCFRIMLPLTLAIIDAIIVQTGDERYVVPIAQVYESVQPTPSDIHHVTGMGDVLSIRGENLPLFRLSTILSRKVKSRETAESIALIVRTGEKPFAMLVDDIVGQQQVVIKRLGEELQNVRGFSGSAILGDGRAALILDLNELVNRITTRDVGQSKNARSAA